MGELKPSGEIIPLVVQGMQPPGETPSESSTKPCPCGFAFAPFDGLCGECHTRRGWDEDRKRKGQVDNQGRRRELVAAIGEEAAARWTLDNFKPYDETTAKALQRAKAFTPAVSNLYLTGTTGCGKSHLSVAIAIRAFDDGKVVYFFPSGPALSRWFRKDMDAEAEERKIKELAAADVLVINELGIGRDTEYSIGIAVEVIDARIMRGKNGLVVTSNYHPVDLARKMNDTRLESRFTGLCEIIEAGKEDYRKAHRQP